MSDLRERMHADAIAEALATIDRLRGLLREVRPPISLMRGTKARGIILRIDVELGEAVRD